MRCIALALLAACGGSHPAPVAAPAAPKPTAFTDNVSGHGRVVVFIPGLGSPGAVWNGTVAHLHGTVEAHVLTLAGFAGQPAIDAPFLQTAHDQLAAYIKTLDHPILVGHSLGGVLSLWLAETNSADLGGVIDVDGLPFFAAVLSPTVTEAHAREQAAGLRTQLLALTAEQRRDQITAMFGGMVTKPDDQTWLIGETLKSDPTAFANAFTDLLGKDLRPDLSKISTKVTIVAATNIGPNETREQLEGSWHAQIDPIPGAKLHFIDNTKHFVMLDQPEAFYAVVDEALK